MCSTARACLSQAQPAHAQGCQAVKRDRARQMDAHAIGMLACFHYHPSVTHGICYGLSCAREEGGG